MRIAALDPPYIGQSQRHYGDHPDFAGEVDHLELLRSTKEYDGWFLHCSAPTLPLITRWADEVGVAPYRIMAWVKPFAAFKRNVPVAYAWEPVLVSPARKPTVTGRTVMRDWCAESITMQRGLSGAKPEVVSRWLFEVVGAEPGDELVDVFPGSGAITAAWERWRADVLNPGTAPSPADDRYTRLPKWAQMEMEAMRGEVDYLSARALQNTAGRP